MQPESHLLVRGKFEGTFYTLQKEALSPSGSSSELNSHAVRLFEGTISETLSPAAAETPLDKGDFHFHGASNIQILPGSNWPHTHKRIFTLDELHLYDVEILHTWHLDGKTYGKLIARAFGRVAKDPWDNAPEAFLAASEKPVQPSPPDQSLPGEGTRTFLGAAAKPSWGGSAGPQHQFSGTKASLRSSFSNRTGWFVVIVFVLLFVLLNKGCNSAVPSFFSCWYDNWKLSWQLGDLREEEQRLRKEIEQNKLLTRPCAQHSSNGKNEIAVDYYELGQRSGKVTVFYSMATIPDMMEIYYDGALVATTNDAVKGEGSLSWDYVYQRGKPTHFVVKMVPSTDENTVWSYELSCPH